MTRVNCNPASELLDEHLRADYREITRLWSHAMKYAEGNDKRPLPETYRLGTGHMRFFLDKGKWVHRRFNELTAEMQARGFQTPKEWREWPAHLYNDWTPTVADLSVIYPRLVQQVPKKKLPHWWGERITVEAGERHYQHLFDTLTQTSSVSVLNSDTLPTQCGPSQQQHDWSEPWHTSSKPAKTKPSLSPSSAATSASPTTTATTKTAPRPTLKPAPTATHATPSANTNASASKATTSTG